MWSALRIVLNKLIHTLYSSAATHALLNYIQDCSTVSVASEHVLSPLYDNGSNTVRPFALQRVKPTQKLYVSNRSFYIPFYYEVLNPR